MAIKDWQNLDPEWLQAEGVKMKFGIPLPRLKALVDRRLIRCIHHRDDPNAHRCTVTYCVEDIRKWCYEAAE